MDLEENPVHFLAQAGEDAAVERAEAVQHPRLLIVRQVLDREVVAEGVAGLRERRR